MGFERDLIKKVNQKISNSTKTDENAGRCNNLSTDAVITKIFKQDAKCHYCKQPMKLTNWEKFDKKQFTLERLNNSKSHCLSNVVISCWGCNELRGDKMSSVQFKKITDSDMAFYLDPFKRRPSKPCGRPN